jgi:hypothetical protein
MNVPIKSLKLLDSSNFLEISNYQTVHALFKGPVVSLNELNAQLEKSFRDYTTEGKEYLVLCGESQDFTQIQILLSLLNRLVSLNDKKRRTALNKCKRVSSVSSKANKAIKLKMTESDFIEFCSLRKANETE